MIRRVLAAAVLAPAFAAATMAVLTASAPATGADPLPPPTVTTTSSLPCVEVTNTDPPAYLLVCPPL